MINADIVNNQPCCSKCGQTIYSLTRDIKQVKYRGESLTLFIKYCYNCKEDIQYLADVLIEKTTRYKVEDVFESLGGEYESQNFTK